MEDLVKELQENPEKKAAFLKALDVPTLPEDSKIKEITDPSVLQNEIAKLRNEAKTNRLEAQNYKGKLSEIERLEKEQKEKRLIEDGKLKEVIDAKNKELEALKSNYQKKTELLTEYETKIENERLKLLDNVPIESREALKDSSKEVILEYLKLVEKRTGSPGVERKHGNTGDITVDKLSTMTPKEMMELWNHDPDLFNKLTIEKANS